MNISFLRIDRRIHSRQPSTGMEYKWPGLRRVIVCDEFSEFTACFLTWSTRKGGSSVIRYSAPYAKYNFLRLLGRQLSRRDRHTNTPALTERVAAVSARSGRDSGVPVLITYGFRFDIERNAYE